MESNVVIIPYPLVSPDFSPKIQKMLSKPKLPKNLQVIRIKGEKLVKEICISLQINMIRSSSPPKHKWELFDGQIYQTKNDFPPWKNFVIRQQDGKIYKLSPVQTEDSTKESVLATNWTNLALSSLEKFLRTQHKSIEDMNNILKEMMIRMLQKQDYATVCSNENVKTLAENDKHIVESLDNLKLSTEKKIQVVTIIQGREIVKVNSSLDILKRQVSNVSISVDSLKKRHPTDSYKSTTLFSEPHSQMPYTISSSVSSLIR